MRYSVSSASKIHPLLIEPSMVKRFLKFDSSVHALKLNESHQRLLLFLFIEHIILLYFLNELAIQGFYLAQVISVVKFLFALVLFTLL